MFGIDNKGATIRLLAVKTPKFDAHENSRANSINNADKRPTQSKVKVSVSQPERILVGGVIKAKETFQGMQIT